MLACWLKFLLVWIVGDEAARGGPALVKAGADMGGAGAGSAWRDRIAEGFFEVGGIVERAQIFERGHAGLAVGVVGGNLPKETQSMKLHQGSFVAAGRRAARSGEPVEDGAGSGEPAERAGSGSGRYIQ
jgi:hypothetical protein